MRAPRHIRSINTSTDPVGNKNKNTSLLERQGSILATPDCLTSGGIYCRTLGGTTEPLPLHVWGTHMRI